jgi:FtsP/CotA-like multicopper oxidase with cupredoxin domain
MNHIRRYALRISILFAVIAALLGFTALWAGEAYADTLPAATCTYDGISNTRTCELWAKTGTLSLPGSTVPIWGYSDTSLGAAQLPGPALIANQGETVEVILHNDLAETTALVFPGQAMIPDLAGAAAGGTVTYTLVASSAGTYLYEAGLLPNAQHQVAMGLYGALIVRPAAANQAYDDAGTAFDDEALLVLSEIDPDLNNSPAAFDMRDYKARYRLINGKAYPDTDEIPTAAGNRVLLRYVNAGLEQHSMGLLGMHQEILAVDGSPYAYSYQVAAQTIGHGQTADRIATVPTSVAAFGDTRFALYDTSMLLHNNGAAGFGGMLTFLTVPDGGPGPDTAGPATHAPVLAPNPTDGSVDVTVSATVSDVATGNANIAAAEYFVGAPGADGTGIAMLPTDGTFDSPTEGASGTITITTLTALASGDHTVYIHGQDSMGNWGFFNFAVLNLDKAGPATMGIVLAPNPSDGTADVALAATGDDTLTGNSNIAAAEYFFGVDPGAGNATPMAVNMAAPAASLDATIPAATVAALGEGAHLVYVRSQDALGNWGDTASATVGVDQTGPDTSNVSADPNPNSGSLPVNPTRFAVRVDATISDPVNPAINGVNSNIQAAEGFIDTVGADGTGFPLTPGDGLFDSPSEDGYAYIPLATISPLTEGSHPIYVHGRDASGNWGAPSSVVLIIDKTRPVVSNVSATPNPTDGANLVTLTADAADLASNIAMAEWFEGADPGPGNGTPMAATDGTFDSLSEALTATIDVGAWAEGDHTLYVRARDAAGNWSFTGSTVVTVIHAPSLLLFSTLANAPVPDVAGPYDDADIYGWDGTRFRRRFDASAVGLPGHADIDGLVVVDADTAYMSFRRDGGTTVPGLGTVQDEDIVLYDAGTWTTFFVGGVYGLNAEDAQELDAIDIVDGILYFSTYGNGVVSGVVGPYDDADIYSWDGIGFSRVFDGTAAGLPPGADIDGLVVVDADTFYMSFTRGGSRPGLGTVEDEDVVLYDAGTWTVFFEGGLYGLGASNGQDLDALHLVF